MKTVKQSHRVNSREHLKELTQGKFKYFTLEFDGHTIQRYGMTPLVSESYRIPNKVKEELADELPILPTFLHPLLILRSREEDPISKIVGLTIPPVSNTPLVKVEYTRNHQSYYTLYSMGNFSDDTLKLLLSSAEEAMASDDNKDDMPGSLHICK